MTTVYFVRHAEADNSHRDGRIRPLTEKGLADRKLVTEFLQDKQIDAVISSPFKRAIDTLSNFAEQNGFEIEIVEDFRERKSDSDMNIRDNKDFTSFMERQWAYFSYTFSDGECLTEVQVRNIAALNYVLSRYKNKTIAIGTHGTALSTIINYYDKTYGFDDFMAMVNIMPWVVKMEFNEYGCMWMEKIDLFNLNQPNLQQHKVCTADLGELKAYKFIVTFARYQDKWLYCRAKERDTFETAGGHIEEGETPLEAAKRELYEEMGATKYNITPAFDYSVHNGNRYYSHAQVFFAQVHELGDMPNFEMAEVKLFDAIPDKMRFPLILPVLYEKLQNWLDT